MPFDQPLHDRTLAVRGGAHPVALLGLRNGVGHPLVLGEGHPHLGALGRGDPALGLDLPPRRVVPLGADQGEDVALPTVLTDQRGGQAEPPPGLDVGGHPKDRRRQQVHLVVDDQTPVAGAEQVQMQILALATGGHHLVCGDRDGSDLLAFTRVLADLVLGE